MLTECYIKYSEYLKKNNLTPKVGDKVFCCYGGNFAEQTITYINSEGWLYTNNYFLIGTVDEVFKQFFIKL